MKTMLLKLETYLNKLSIGKISFEHVKVQKYVKYFFKALESGQLRSAKKISNNKWIVNKIVKKCILLCFKHSKVVSIGNKTFPFSDKKCFILQKFSKERNIRIVPAGSSVRSGSFLGKNVTIMSPSYVNVGAFIDDETIIDSNVLIGSCAQIGKRVHISAGVQIGGVLEPLRTMPVIIENDCLIGGNSGIFEGSLIRERAIISAGVILTNSTKIFDVVNKKIININEDGLLEVPSNAVVVPGARKVIDRFSENYGLSLFCPIIVKYRDQRTNSKIILNNCLR